MLKSVSSIRSAKYILVEHKNLRKIEIGINVLLLLIMFFIGSVTDLIYFVEYKTGMVTMSPQTNFIMEGRLNNDLFQVGSPDIYYQFLGDTITLPKQVIQTVQKNYYCPKYKCERACVDQPSPNLVAFFYARISCGVICPATEIF